MEVFTVKCDPGTVNRSGPCPRGGAGQAARRLKQEVTETADGVADCHPATL